MVLATRWVPGHRLGRLGLAGRLDAHRRHARRGQRQRHQLLSRPRHRRAHDPHPAPTAAGPPGRARARRRSSGSSSACISFVVMAWFDQPAGGVPDAPGHRLLRRRLHDAAQALDTAEHRHRRRRRGAAAGHRLGGRHRRRRDPGADPVRARLLLDAAPFLGAVAAHPQGLRRGRRADAARRPGHPRDDPPDRAVHAPDGRDLAGPLAGRADGSRSTSARRSASGRCSSGRRTRCGAGDRPRRHRPRARSRLYRYSISYLSLLFLAIAVDALVLASRNEPRARRGHSGGDGPPRRVGLSPCAACRSTSSAAPRPSPARSSCSRPIERGSWSIAGCSRAARTSRSATGSRSGSTRRELDAVVLTHAHLDHCGLLPLLVKAGYQGTIHATAGTVELATLVLLDSGHLHEEFAKREARWEKRHPDGSRRTTASEAEAYQAAVDLAAAGGSEEGAVETASARPARSQRRPRRTRRPSRQAAGEHVETSDRARAAARLAARPRGRAARASRRRSRSTSTCRSTRSRMPSGRSSTSGRSTTTRSARSRPGVWATFLDAGHILGLGDHPAACPGDGGEERVIVCSGDLGRPGTPIIRDPTVPDRRGLRPRRVDVRWPRTRAAGRGHPDPGRDRPPRRRGRAACCSCRRSRSAARRRSSGSSTGSSSAARSRCCRSTSTRRWPRKASDIYRRYSEYYDEETARLLREGDTPLDYPAQIVTNTPRSRRRSSSRRGRT